MKISQDDVILTVSALKYVCANTNLLTYLLTYIPLCVLQESVVTIQFVNKHKIMCTLTSTAVFHPRIEKELTFWSIL